MDRFTHAGSGVMFSLLFGSGVSPVSPVVRFPILYLCLERECSYYLGIVLDLRRVCGCDL